MERAVEERRYKVEEAARTLTRAEEIKQDGKLFAEAQAELKKQGKAIQAAMGRAVIEKDKKTSKFRIRR